MQETSGTIKLLDIQDKQGYSVVTFEIPNEHIQVLLEYSIQTLFDKLVKQQHKKFKTSGKSREKSDPTALDNTKSMVYNQLIDTTDWNHNTGSQPVDDNVLIDVQFKDGKIMFSTHAGWWYWDGAEADAIIAWRLTEAGTEHKTVKGK